MRKFISLNRFDSGLLLELNKFETQRGGKIK